MHHPRPHPLHSESVQEHEQNPVHHPLHLIESTQGGSQIVEPAVEVLHHQPQIHHVPPEQPTERVPVLHHPYQHMENEHQHEHVDREHHLDHLLRHEHHHHECREYVTIIGYADIILSQFEAALCIYILVRTITFTINFSEEMPRILHVLTATACFQIMMCATGTYLALRLLRASRPLTPATDALRICECWQLFNIGQILLEFIVIVLSDISQDFAIPAGNISFLYALDRIFGLVVVHKYAVDIGRFLRRTNIVPAAPAPLTPAAIPDLMLNNLA